VVFGYRLRKNGNDEVIVFDKLNVGNMKIVQLKSGKQLGTDKI